MGLKKARIIYEHDVPEIALRSFSFPLASVNNIGTQKAGSALTLPCKNGPRIERPLLPVLTTEINRADKI